MDMLPAKRSNTYSTKWFLGWNGTRRTNDGTDTSQSAALVSRAPHENVWRRLQSGSPPQIFHQWSAVGGGISRTSAVLCSDAPARHVRGCDLRIWQNRPRAIGPPPQWRHSNRRAGPG